mmetsp:Transcript_40445/g.47325  ORF Transcript_40445/g.47325 Transcript_40445/m.47325 type:complete len:231 (-) Transcript_40445:1068-1760(-)
MRLLVARKFSACCNKSLANLSPRNNSSVISNTVSLYSQTYFLSTGYNNVLHLISHRTISSAKIPFKNSKIVRNARESLANVPLGGVHIAIGGFGLGGVPETLIDALLLDKNARDLTVISLTAGIDGFGLGKLIETEGKVKRLISSYVGENKALEKRFFNGTLEVELTPQGTIAARLAAGGAGIPAFFTPTGFSKLFIVSHSFFLDCDFYPKHRYFGLHSFVIAFFFTTQQ